MSSILGLRGKPLGSTVHHAFATIGIREALQWACGPKILTVPFISHPYYDFSHPCGIGKGESIAFNLVRRLLNSACSYKRCYQLLLMPPLTR